MYILGISAFYHDSAITLLKGSEIIAAAQEERFTRIKNDSAFPHNALLYCLKEAGISASDIHAVVYYDKPFLTFERLLETYLTFAPRGFKSFMLSMPVWIKEKLFLKGKLQRDLKKSLKQSFANRIYFSQHHLSHAASAFFPSPFDEAAILTIDGVGEWATATIGHGQGSSIKLLKQMNFPHSWGLFYSAITSFLGFKVNSGEYKLMGLAPYGNPISSQTLEFCKSIEENLLQIHSDGSLTLNMDYFSFATSDKMIPFKKWEALFGIPARAPDSLLSQAHANLAWAAQHILEKGVLKLAREAKRITNSSNLVLAGGVALNCVANGKIKEENIFESIWIQPAAHDAGGSLGAAYAFSHIHENLPRTQTASTDQMKGAYLGPSYSDSEILERLRKYNLPYRQINDFNSLCELVANFLEEEKVVGWFQDRMEWGPRALGNRSILASALKADTRKKINLKIKFRESFRPFAPIVLAEDVSSYFDFVGTSPYMLLTAKVKNAFRLSNAVSNFEENISTPYSQYPAITHVDYSARLQTVHQQTNSKLWQLMQAYKNKTGHSILVNTSFNVRGEPIVCSPEDALECFLSTDMDICIIGTCVYEKNSIPINVIEHFRNNKRYANKD